MDCCCSCCCCSCCRLNSCCSVLGNSCCGTGFDCGGAGGARGDCRGEGGFGVTSITWTTELSSSAWLTWVGEGGPGCCRWSRARGEGGRGCWTWSWGAGRRPGRGPRAGRLWLLASATPEVSVLLLDRSLATSAAASLAASRAALAAAAVIAAEGFPAVAETARGARRCGVGVAVC